MGAVENCFWNYFQGCHVNKDNFEKWLFSISMAINTQKATNKTSPCIVLNFLDRTEILQITSENFFQETKNVLTRFQDGQESWITFQYINSNDSKQKSRVLSQENSTSKAGIQVILHDSRSRMNRDMGFSIKSQLGGDSTLLNASGATNFVYRIEGCDFSDEDIECINAIDTRTKIIDRIGAIERKGGSLVFDKVDNDTFRTTLQMMDGDLAKVIAHLLLEQFKTGNRMLSDLTADLANDNPLGYEADDLQSIYAYKLKHLLTSAALGMMPSKAWTGHYDANGGYLVVKKDGEILCYHFYDHNRFEDFIFRNAYLERAKTRRHGYGSLYRGEDGNVYFKLNLQIRLK